ncbi:UNVERIFIED_CONTAM: hypothetical protein Slati_0032900 [Sesamum latifolium]|uniref:CCHC-type domain-containing protein n=1 Tax=Sesamum latifolium TaxID=2727402 RepID=A0AAW2Y6Y7_9LAMI
MEVGESVHMATQEKNKDQAKGKGKANVPPHAEIKKESKCFFCKKKGHIKKDCPKFKIWLEKKDFTDFDTCVDCIKGKQTNVSRKGEALDAFKVFKAEVEKQCDKQIKIVRSDRGGEYFGRYTEGGQAPGPFAKFLAEQGIVAQYTMPGSLDQNV